MNEFEFQNRIYTYQMLGEEYPITFIIKSNNSENPLSLGMLSFDYINNDFTVTGMINQSMCLNNDDVNKLINLILNEILKENVKAKIDVQLMSN